MDLVRDGWEPLVQRSYCCCFTQPSVAHAPLSDHKGLTARAKLERVRWLRGGSCKVVVVQWSNQGAKVLMWKFRK